MTVNKSPDDDEYNYKEDYWRCGRADDCGLKAGWGTDHVGVGACRIHGGNAGRPLESGIYSDVVRPEDRELLDALEAIETRQKLEETLNLQIMKLRRAIELTANPDDEESFWDAFNRMVHGASINGEEPGLSGKQLRELGKILDVPESAQMELMDLIRKTAKDLHKIEDDSPDRVEHSVDTDRMDEFAAAIGLSEGDTDE